MSKTYLRSGAALLACLAPALLTGCNTVHANRAATAYAPGLHEDGTLNVNGGANPNAPYTMVDHSAHLVKRATLLDVNAAEPCTASSLNLFESGAHVDGDRRSVRLNLVNHAAQPCRLSGYPSISLLRQDGSLIGSLAIEKVTVTTLEAALKPKAAGGTFEDAVSRPSPYVLLAPSGEATFEVGWTSGPRCEQVGAIAVAAPGTVQSFIVHHSFSLCEGRILVTAISDGAQL